MSFIKQALEECNGCRTGNQINQVDGWKGAPDPKAIVDTDTTYDDGKGIKDTVVISGPLSHAYTQALLLTLKKEPLQGKEEAPSATDIIEEVTTDEDPLLKKNNKEQIGISTEGMQQDEDIESFMIQELHKNSEEISYLANKFDFVKPDQLPVNVVCNTTLISMTDFMKIESFVEFTKDRGNSSVQYAVVVLPDSLNRTTKNTVQSKFVNVDLFDSSKEDEMKNFNAAVEAHVKPAGYKVFVGMEEYFGYLHDLSMKLRK